MDGTLRARGLHQRLHRSSDRRHRDRDHVDRTGPLPSRILALTGDPNEGAFEFTQQCLRCHPAPGATNPLGYPPLENTVPGYSDGQLVLVVVEGFVDAAGNVIMPDYAEYFTNQDVADVVAYMRLTYGAAAPPAR